MAMDMATLGIKVDATDVTKASAELDKLSTAGGKTAQSMTSAEKAAASMGVRMNSLNSITAAFGVTLGLAGVAAFGKSLADTVQKIQDLSIRLKGLTKSADDYAKVQAYLVDISIRHHKSNLVLADSFSRLLTLEQSGLITRKQSMALLEGMSNASSKTGASTEQLKQSMFGLSQAMGSGVVHMEELNQVTEPMPGLLNKIAEASGFTVGEFRKLIAEGRVTSDVFGRIMVGAFESYSGAAEAAGETITAKYADIGNAWTDLAKLLEAPVSGTLTSILEAATWQLEQFVIQAKYAKSSWESIFGASATGGAPDNGMTIDLKGRAKPPVQVDAAKANSAAIRAEIEATAGSTKGKKDLEKAANDAARAQASLAKSFDDTVKALSLNNVEQSQTKRQLEEATLASKGYNKAMIAQAMALWDAGAALTAKKQLNEEEKSQLDSLIDRYNKATMSARDYYSSTLTVTSPDGIKSPMSGADKAPLLAQFDKTTGAETAKKAQEDAKTALDAYNSSLDAANTKTQDLGGITTAIFDGALGGISLMTGALTTMTDSLAENSKAMTELNKNQLLNNSISDPKERATNFKKYAKEEATLNAKNVQDQMTGTRQLAGAASKLFADKSAGAKAFHAIEVGIAVAQLAMRAKDMAMSAIATVKNIAEGASKLFAQSGWLGFAGVAAMLALMAGLGAMASGGGGGGSSTPPPTDTGTGTVLGDPTAVSESIGKTNDLLKTIHASEYVELRGINRGVNNLQNAISKTVDNLFQTGGMANFQPAAQKNPSILDQLNPLSGGGLGAVVNTIRAVGSLGLSIISDFIISKIPILGSIMSSINRFFFGGKVTKSVVGQGIATVATPLQSVIDGGDVGGYQYANIKTHTSGGLFTKSKDKYSMQYQALSPETQKSFNDIFSSVGDTIVSIADALGKGIKTDLMPRVMSAIIPAMSVSLMGLSGEEASKKLNGVISAMMDTMTTQIFGDIVGKYQKLGESMLETTVRIVSEVTIVKDALNQSGLSLTTDIIAISDALIQTAGGIEAFQQQFESFFDKFYSDAEKQTRLQKTLVGSLAEANVILPTTRENYKKLVEGLNMTNPLDQQRYSLLLELSAAADTYYSMLEKGAEKVAAIAKTQRSLDIQYMELTGDAVGALTEKRKDELAAMDESLRLTHRSIYALTDANKAVADATTVVNKAVTDAMALASKAVSAAVNDVSKAISNLSSLAQKLRGALTGNTISTDATTRKDRADAQAVLNAALKVANAGGSIDNFAGMDKALTDIAKPSEQLYSSFTDYARDQALTSGTITQLADYADAQVNMAQKQIDAINGVGGEVFKVNDSIVKMMVSNNGQTGAIIDVNGKIVALTGKAVLTTEGVALVDGKVVKLTRQTVDLADGTTKEVTKVNGKVVDLTTLSDGTKQAIINVDGKVITLTSSQISSEIDISTAVSDLLKAQESLATVADQKTQIEKMLGTTSAVLTVGAAINALTIALNAQTAITKAIATAQQTAKATTTAEIAMNKAISKSKASGSDLSDANADKQKYKDAAYNAQLNIDYIAVRAEVTRLVAEYQASPSAAGSKAVNDYLISVQSKFNEKYDSNPYVAADKMWTLSPKYKGDGSYALPKAGTQTISEATATASSIATLASAIDALIPSLLVISAKDTLSASAAISFYNAALVISKAAAGAVPAFASGGQHEGGWRIVGENGPELEKTGASRIFSNPQSKSLLSMDELIAEIQALRSDVRAGQQAIANNTLRTAKILRDVTQDGTAITTVVAA